MLKHEPQKRAPVFSSGQTLNACPKIMLKQQADAKIGFDDVEPASASSQFRREMKP
jgi:hypothetical protein